MIKFYKKYKDWFVCVLAFFLCCKSCQSCHRANQIEWNQIQTEQQLDSLNGIIRTINTQIDGLNDTIRLVNEQANLLLNEKNILKENNKALLNSNKHIIRKNKNN